MSRILITLKRRICGIIEIEKLIALRKSVRVANIISKEECSAVNLWRPFYGLK